jgi:lysophospholipase L1-like esterase
MIITLNKYINNAGGLSDNTSGDYSVSDYIQVKSNTTYATNVATGAGKIACYDDAFELLGAISETSVSGVYQFTTLANTKYIRITIFKASYSALPKNAIVNEGTSLLDYQNFTDNERTENLYRTFYGKRVFVESVLANNSVRFVAPNTKSGNLITFDATLDGTFTQLDIRHGYNEPYAASYVRITSTEIIVYDTLNTTLAVRERYTHNLTIANHLTVIIDVFKVDTAKITITVPSGQYVNTINWEGCRGDIALYNAQDSCTLRNVNFIHSVKDYSKDIWAYGDSYFDFWPKVAQNMGFTNAMFDGYGGRTSTGGLASLNINLQYKTPKVILWCLGMNDPDSDTEVNADWLDTFNTLKTICKNKKIELVLMTIPNTPTHNHTFKNEIVKNSGYRYIDVAEAVGASTYPSNWYAGLLSSDNIHPTHSFGKQVIASKVIASLPELSNHNERAVKSKLNIIGDVTIDEVYNEVVYKDGMVYVRYQGTIQTEIPNGRAFLKLGSELYPSNIAGTRQAVFGEMSWQPKIFFVGNNQGNIYTTGVIPVGTFISFNFSYYLGYRNYEIEE